MKKIQKLIVALSLTLFCSVPLSGQHFVPVYESLYQPMNIIVDVAQIGGVDLEAGDEIGIYDTTISGVQICVGSKILTGPVVPGNPLPIVASADDALTPDQDGFIDGHLIFFRIWDASESQELICVSMTYTTIPGFNEVFTSLGTALGSLDSMISPTADAGADDETCEDAPYTLSGSATNQASVEWTTSGDGTFDDATSLTATYTPGTNDISNGMALLALNAYASYPCWDHASDTMTLSIQALPTADAGEDDGVCFNTSYTLSGQAENYDAILWTSSGDGNFDDATSLNATYIPGTGDINNGSVTLTLTAVALTPCSPDAEDSMVLTILSLPSASAGPDATICEGESHTLQGTAVNHLLVVWTSSGDGVFNNPNLLNATYTPGPGDISNGTVDLTIFAFAIPPCSSGVTDMMTLSIDPLAGTPETPSGPIEVDIHVTPTSQYETQTVQGATAYAWTLSPSGAGSIAGSDINATVTWNAAYHGLAYVMVIALNDCGGIMSDSLEINVYNSVGFPENATDQISVLISPNPNRGAFKLNISSTETELEMTLYSSEGNLIRHEILKVDSKLEKDFNFSDLPKGMYFLRLYNERLNLIKKVIIQ